MDISIRNDIILANILPLVDLSTSMKLSAVCIRWYEQINNNTKLWDRLVQLEQIEDPEYWYRIDDNEQWTLGTPCKPKNILLNYRRTYYCFKHNICKKYTFNCDLNTVFKYDGRILLFTLDKVLHIYKVINNSLQLFQTIDLKIHWPGYEASLAYTNVEFIVIYASDGSSVKTFSFDGNKYVEYNQRSFGEIGSLFDAGREPGKLLNTNIHIDTYYKIPTFTLVAWNIPEDRIIFKAPNNKFIKHDKGIIYVNNRETSQLLLYNEYFEVIYSINEDFKDGVLKVIVNEELIYIEYAVEDESARLGFPTLCIPSMYCWDKATRQIISRSQILSFDDSYYQIFPVNNNIIVTFPYTHNPTIECYNSKFVQLWSHSITPHEVPTTCDYLFKKLMVVRQMGASEESFIEFRDVNNGNVLFTTKLFDDMCWQFSKELLTTHGGGYLELTVLLYR